MGSESDLESAQASLVTWLAVGTVVGGALQFLVQLPGVLRLSRGLRMSVRTDLPGVRTTYALPISLFGVAVAAAELPELAGASARQLAAVAARLEAGRARITVFVLPTVVAYLVVGDLLVAAVFQGGAFGRLDAGGVATPG